MRLRNIPGAREAIAENPFVFVWPDLPACRGRWNQIFANPQPLFLEIGMGKGKFLSGLARKKPEVNYLGIEKYSSVLLRALQKREVIEKEAPLQNLLYARMEAETLTEVFAPGEVSGIYLNFSDPWPKDRHAKRRLTSRSFLQRYASVLAPGAAVEFKTDNDDLFAFSVQEAREEGWRILCLAEALYADPQLAADNVPTEYEERFSALGNPIHKMVIAPPGGN